VTAIRVIVLRIIVGFRLRSWTKAHPAR